jgi:ParB family chromosome partitioning protein
MTTNSCTPKNKSIKRDASVSERPEVGHTQYLGTIVPVKIADITIPKNRLRKFNKSKMLELAESIKTTGLLHPPILDRNKKLVAGLHRVKAAQHLGWDTIKSHVLDEDDPLRLKLVEIDENLMRNELDQVAIGEHAVQRDKILEMLGLRAKVGQGRPAKNRELHR